VPRCFPAAPDFAAGRTAERTAWEALRNQLPDEAVLFHSVGLIEGEREQELDLLVAWPGVGIGVIEVKGGHVTRDADGWHRESAGKKRRIGSPGVQAQDGRHVLTRYLERNAPDAAKARTAHVVVTPFTTVPSTWSAADCPRTMLLDKADLADAAGCVRAAIEQHGAGHQPLSPAGVDALVQALSGQLPGQTSLLSAAEEHEQRLDQMTRDQVKILDGFRYHDRLKVIGGAGTGKTWLALEQARRLGKSGDRVALLCYSRGLARYFERITASWPTKDRPSYVGLFHRLPIEWGAAEGADDDSDYWERRLPVELGQLAAARAPTELFDSIVVDEAQDFGELWWTSLLACLRDPVKGKLFVFLDEAQRVFLRQGVVPIELPPYVLGENIRNTKKIAQLFGSLSGELLKPRGMEGAPVRLVDVPVDEVIEAADNAVDALVEEGWEPGHVALLTTQHRHPEQKNAVDLGGWASYWDAFFAEEDVFYGHVLGFKGLERQVVVLAVNGFREAERAKEMLYVGLSRARSLLVIVGPRPLVEQVGGSGVLARLKKVEVWRP